MNEKFCMNLEETNEILQKFLASRVVAPTLRIHATNSKFLLCYSTKPETQPSK